MPLVELGGTFAGGTFGGGSFGGGTFGGEGFAGGGIGACFTGTGGGLLGGFGICGFAAGMGGGVCSGGPKRSFGTLPLLGALSSGWKDIARPTEPHGIPFRGALGPFAEELPWPLPLSATL